MLRWPSREDATASTLRSIAIPKELWDQTESGIPTYTWCASILVG